MRNEMKKPAMRCTGKCCSRWDVEQGFPVVHLVHVGQTYWTVVKKKNVPDASGEYMGSQGGVTIVQWARRQLRNEYLQIQV